MLVPVKSPLPGLPVALSSALRQLALVTVNPLVQGPLESVTLPSLLQ